MKPMITSVTLPLNYTVIQAAAFARQLHCRLVWRGTGFVLLRGPVRPRGGGK